MLTAQGDSPDSKTDSKSKEEARGFSWGMILLGLALLAGAVLLYLYAASNRPKNQTTSNNISNISRTPPDSNTTNSQTTPSPARPALNAPSRDKATEDKKQ
jgi:hypothetical protein